MAEFELSPAFEKVRRKLGNMIFYVSEGDVFARKRGGKQNGATPAQEVVREAFTELAGSWKYLEGIVQDSWNAAAKRKKRLKGYSAFLGANIDRQRKARPLELAKSFGEKALVSFGAQAGAASGTIDCSFVKNASDADKYVTIFHQKKANAANGGAGTDATGGDDADGFDGDAGNEIVRVECGNDGASPVTVSGLEPGAEYFLYAVVTDSAYGEATAVSMARAALCRAGE